MQLLKTLPTRRRLIFLIPIVLFVASIGVYGQAHAQTPIDLSNLSTQEVVYLIIIGILATALQAYQGFTKQGEPFDGRAFFDRILTGALHSIWLSIMAAASYTTLTPITYVLIFGAAVGMTELTMKQMQPTTDASTSTDIPSPPPSPPTGTAKSIDVGDDVLSKDQ